MLGTISTLLIWRLLKILKIPSPVNVLLAVITSIFVAVVYHPIASNDPRQTGWEFFNLGVFPTLLGSIAAGLLILSRTSGISETKLIKTDNDGVTPISYTES
jgi:energy-converting hydrogenase Eha subunit A